ncbi:Gnt-II system L-idonate transporter [Anatilimnocola aggregata]|uniref:Gnt-II system L-idonate transporter n=1 Tax=Anatilimnocola aggregata TaxID=2528021 RepID=A0A517Y9Z6_9BACT|nr:SLC13 family permease [Anatilimnocola aggregata]QDU27067.1 Gnt-II system L-idonate transporter [Anatilimnocola aggregata]
MSAVIVLLLGLAIVIGGVLALRLHAFVALILAALAVASLTPTAAFVRQSLLDRAKKLDVRIESAETTEGVVQLSAPSHMKLDADTEWIVIRAGRDPWKFTQLGKLVPNENSAPTLDHARRQLFQARFAASGAIPPLNSGGLMDFPTVADVVVTTPILQAATADAAKISPPDQVAAGFGSTAAGIGILIAFASIVGKCLLDSGAADRVVRSALKITGESGAPAAFVGSGFLLGIPVFFDTVFYLMLPLGKALCLRTGKNYLFYVLTIVAGATMAHSLVPPTPGPLLVAAELHVNMGLMMVVGTLVGGGAVMAGYFFSAALNRRFELPLRNLSTSPQESTQSTELPEASLPPLWLSLLPLLLPVFLIGGAELFAVWLRTRSDSSPQIPAGLLRAISLLGDKNVALIIAAAIAVATLVWMRRISRKELARSLQDALAGAGVIILITSAGGAFGKVMQQTGVASLISDLPVHSTPAILTMAFLVTAAVRTAQGSATVAMITAVGILAPLANAGQLNFHPVWLAMAIGCGSKPLAWMNDSGFWVITQMSGMTEAEGLKYITTLLLVMSIVGLALTIAGAILVPLR